MAITLTMRWGGRGVTAEIAAALPAIIAAIDAGTSIDAAIASVLPSLEAAATVQLANDIRAVIYGGVGDYLALTSVKAGVSASNAFTGVWSGRLNSNGSDMTLIHVPNAITFERTSANRFRLIGGASAQAFTNITTAISMSAGYMAVAADCSGKSSTLKVTTSATTYTGVPTSGSAISFPLGGRWCFGATLTSANVAVTSGASKWLDGNTSLWWANNARAGLAASVSIEEWWDTTNDKLRDPGVSGANATGSSPLVVFDQFAANHNINRGTGRNADAASISGDDTSPGTYAEDYAAASLEFSVVATANDQANAAAATYSAISLGAVDSNRTIYAIALAQAGIAVPGAGPTLTLDGDAMTVVASAIKGTGTTWMRGNIFSITQALMTSANKTAGNFTVTYPGGQHRGKGLVVYRGVGYDATPADVTAAVSVGTTLSARSTWPANGFVIAGGGLHSGTALTWSGNVTENFDIANFNSRLGAASMDALSAGANSITVAGSASNVAQCLLVASFAET